MTIRDPLSYYIDFARLLVERDRRIYQEMNAKIEIKGFSSSVQAARSSISAARAKIIEMHQASVSFASTIDDVTTAIKQAESDVMFDVTQLGNGPIVPDPLPTPAPTPTPTSSPIPAPQPSPAPSPVSPVVPVAPPAPTPSPSNPQVLPFRSS